jgi:glycosyltransferase involved in cell wall biosynthesis
MIPRILFHRRYQRFQGGHLKVWDYFQHVASSGLAEPRIFFEPDSVWDATNPWAGARGAVEPRWDPEAADALFLAGIDWESLPPERRGDWPRPVINLIQHVRHADPGHPLFQFLSHRAFRICVSAEIEAALRATGRVNGPLATIPNGIDFSLLPAPAIPRDIPLLIAGLKNPALAELLAARFAPVTPARTVTTRIPRPEFLGLVARSETTLFLPGTTEGFYLPALEGMALGTTVICPDCVGNRSFCLDAENCFRPPYLAEALEEATRRALALPAPERDHLRAAAAATARRHDLGTERSTFLALLPQALAPS